MKRLNLSSRRTRHSFFARLLAGLLTALGGAYGLSVGLFLLVRRLVGERWTLIAIINTILHLLMLPALALLPLSLILRRGWLTLTQLPAALAFVISYGELFVPRTPTAAPESLRLRLLTYNIHAEEEALDPILAIIRETDADLVIIQELSFEAAERFERELADLYPFRALHPRDNGTQGQGILSRCPIRSSDYWRNPDIALQSLGHQRAEVEVNGRLIVVYNAHPIHPGMTNRLFDVEARRQEIERVLDRAARDTGPVLIAGDFNMPDQSDDYRYITARYLDAYREAGWGLGWTFPNWTHPAAIDEYVPVNLPLRPVIRLDYVFHSRHFTTLAAQVWPTSGSSDHHPVLAVLALNEQ